MSGTGRVAAVAVCLGVSLVLTASRSSRAGDEKEDKAQSALQGVYAFRAGSDDGVPDEDTSTDVNVWQFVITGNVLEMKPGFELEKHGLSNGAGFKLKFRLDPKARPRHFDVTGFDATWMKAPINETALGIYKFEKDELTIVIGSGKERPSSLEGGKGLKKMVLVKKSKR